MIHWSWIIFIGVVLFLLYKIRESSNESGGSYYSFDFETSFWSIILIAFILIWGGIFWW
jgi:hypothetical protein